MEGKVLLIQFSFRNGWRLIQDKITIDRLVAEGFQVTNFDWRDFNLYIWEDELFESTIERAVELSQEMDVVYIHFGVKNFPRGRFNEIIEWFKETGVKIVVEGESTVGLESADYVFPASMELTELVKELKKLCQERNESKEKALKILWIDYASRFHLMKHTIEVLLLEGFNVSKLSWYDPDRYDTSEWRIDKVIEAAKKVDVVMVHFGSKPRGEAAEILSRIKATKVKVIVNSASPILFEEADAIILLPFFTEDLINILNGLKD